MDNFIFVILTDSCYTLMKLLYLKLLLFYVCRGSSSLTTFLFSKFIFTTKAPLLSPKSFLQSFNLRTLIDILENSAVT